MAALEGEYPPGILTGDLLYQLMEECNHKQLALPIFNCSSFSIINSILEGASQLNRPVAIQISYDDAIFLAGDGLSNGNSKLKSAVLGSLSAGQHVRLMAKYYNVPVILQTDFCTNDSVDWFEAMLEANEANFKATKEPLFSGLALNVVHGFKSFDAILNLCRGVYSRTAAIKLWLDVKAEEEYLEEVYQCLRDISRYFSIGISGHGGSLISEQKFRDDLMNLHNVLCEGSYTGPFFTVQPAFHLRTLESTSKFALKGVTKISCRDVGNWSYLNGMKEYFRSNQEVVFEESDHVDVEAWRRLAEESLAFTVTEILNCLAEPHKAPTVLEHEVLFDEIKISETVPLELQEIYAIDDKVALWNPTIPLESSSPGYYY